VQTRLWNEYRISRLMLGTAQLGMPYGIANKTGAPDYGQVLKIIAAAAEGGVNCLDTAASYGSSEETLGRALDELKLTDRMVVVTKVKPLTPRELQCPAMAGKAIEKSVNQSRRRLRMDLLPVVLFHHESDAAYIESLMELKGRGWIGCAGVSCDNRPDNACRLIDTTGVSALQLPANILDNRHMRSGVLGLAAERGKAIFIRSVYLQGLLVMPEPAIPAALQDIVPVRRKLEVVAQQAGLTLAELALRYMLSQEGVTAVLTGAESLAQVQENIRLFDHGPLDPATLAAAQAVVPDLPEKLITPSMW
jgi:aryl-alcohol dehydrogenase-like predicted oxidoreductase